MKPYFVVLDHEHSPPLIVLRREVGPSDGNEKMRDECTAIARQYAKQVGRTVLCGVLLDVEEVPAVPYAEGSEPNQRHPLVPARDF